MNPEEEHPLVFQYDLADCCRHLDEWKLRINTDDRVSRPKIQRVPGYMGARPEFEKFYLPKLIAIGPIHHGKPYVELGERYKLMWTSMYLNDTNQSAYGLCEIILQHIGELCQQFSDDVLKKDDSNAHRTIAELLLRDGCSLLQVLEKSYDSEHELRVSIGQLERVHQDLLLLENQIPFQVLKLLCKDEPKLEKCLQNFCKIHQLGLDYDLTLEKHRGEWRDDPIHLLDYLRRALLRRDRLQIKVEMENNRRSLHLTKYRIGSVRELKAAGIHVKKHPHINSFHPLFDFDDGKGKVLYLPKFTVDGSTNIMFLNLIAYEMCQDFRNDFEISSFIVVLSSLIDQPEDVKELRSAGILHNHLASDKEVADLFNGMDTVLVPETPLFSFIRDILEALIEATKSEEKRCMNKVLGWVREAYNKYFSSPWTIIALLAATVGLVLTFIQTWYAIHPKKGS